MGYSEIAFEWHVVKSYGAGERGEPAMVLVRLNIYFQILNLNVVNC